MPAISRFVTVRMRESSNYADIPAFENSTPDSSESLDARPVVPAFRVFTIAR